MNGDASPTRDSLRVRHRKKDDAIRKKVEVELARRAKVPIKKNRGSVKTLKPNQANTILNTARVLQACQLMAAKRTDAVLVVDQEGSLQGILTDKDIAYRVVSESLDQSTTKVSSVMTENPISVSENGNRNDALNIMVSKKFRHLPVVTEPDEDDDENCGNAVAGLLDITKCVFERLDDLEKRVNEDQSIISAMEVLERRGAFDSGHAGSVRQSHECPDIAFVIDQMILDKSGCDVVPSVTIKSSVRDAAKVMKSHHSTAVLVIDEGRVAGIFTTKDIVLRVMAASLDPVNTSVVRVMTPHPDYATPDTTILEALKKLHAGHYRNNFHFYV
jgi:CBS domain-containing protein